MGNAVLPVLPGLRWGRTTTPIWSTRVQGAASGAESRATYQTYPKWRFTLPLEFLRNRATQPELATLIGFYNARNAAFDSFLFDYRADRTVTDQGFGTGNGSTTAFQLVRAYGGYVEPVMNVNAITNVKVGGVITTAYSLSSKGVVTFSSVPANGAALTWSGTYYYRVRFAGSDDLDFEEMTGGQHWKLSRLQMIGSTGDKI